MISTQLVVHLKLPPRRLKPFQRCAIQNDCQPPLRVRLKLLDGIEAALKTAKEHLSDPGSILYCLSKIMDRVSYGRSKSTWLQLRETLAHNHVVPCCLLPVVLLHLR